MIDRKPDLISERDDQEAFAALRQAVEAAPQDVEAHVRLALALVQAAERRVETEAASLPLLQRLKQRLLGDQPAGGRKSPREDYLHEALEILQKALSLDPDHAPARFHLAGVCYELGRLDEAVIAARKAVMVQPFNRYYKEFLAAAEEIYAARSGRAMPRVRELSWDDLVLDAQTKKELQIVLQLLHHPALARSLGIDPPTGILLCGPPGTGKTTVARIMAATAQCQFISTDPAQINSMWVGQSEKNVRSLFRRARRVAPAIIFIDELDALLPIRGTDIGHHTDIVINQFLQEMDGLSFNDRIFVIGATNRPDLLDPAVLRGGRLSRRIELPLPGRAERKQLLKLKTLATKLAMDVDFDLLADATTGMSGGDIKALVSEAGVQALLRHREEADSGSEPEITLQDFQRALHNLRPELVPPAQAAGRWHLIWIRFQMRLRVLLGQPPHEANDRPVQPLNLRYREVASKGVRPLGRYRIQRKA